jgi:ATP-dependent phosphofructokinase / diphosphate-dependent phosphofructokinase
MNVGILTGGGDCPGLNAVIRAVVRKFHRTATGRVVGIRKGWQGLLQGNAEELTLEKVSGILPKGGTILGTSRTNPRREPDGIQRVLDTFHALQLDALIAVGGEDTLGVAAEFCARGLPVVGVPKTIDNDLWGTDYTFGYDTAVNIATEAIDRLHTTAEAHDRVVVVEVMGRHAGWIAVAAGIAGGADLILVPEKPIDLDEVCEILRQRHAGGKSHSIVVVAEGARLATGTGDEGLVTTSTERDAFGHVKLGGIGSVIGPEIQRRTGYDTRVSILGYIQRGGTPTAFDRVLATRFGVEAVNLVLRGAFGNMVALQGNRIVAVPLAEATARLKTVDEDFYEIARVFFG